tara:strand:- start:1160 stop:1930 length:771 start_codon:yes stop_codon:yes gene_type:complete
MDSVVKARDIDINNVGYSAPKVLKNGGKTVYINYDKQKFIVQVPKMSTPYGLSNYNGKYSLNLSFKNLDNNDDLRLFFSHLSALDEKIMEDACDNSIAWLNKKNIQKEVISDFYSPIIKHAKDKKTGEITNQYPPTINIKVPFWDNKFTCDIYDHEKNKVEDNFETVLHKGSQFQSLIQCTGIWFAGSKFGCSWKFLQIRVSKKQNISGYCFIDSDSDNDNDNDNNNNDQKQISSSDDEELSSTKIIKKIIKRKNI